MTDTPRQMTRAERSELGSLIRKREKVMRAAASERAAAMMADFEKQIAAIYFFDDDAVWAKAMAEVKDSVTDAMKEVTKRCEQLGIPKEFAPEINVYWRARGQNAAKERQAELRRVAKTRIEAIEKEAITQIERRSLEAQTQVLAMGLESDAAKEFLKSMPALESMMPTLSATEIKSVVDAKHEQRKRQYDA